MELMEGWHDFFVATVGAAAALAGLLIVAVSVNIREIIANPSVASRAGATIASLILTLVATSAMLIPEQGLRLLGLEILLAAGVTAIFVVQAVIHILRVDDQQGYAAWPKVLIAILQILPFLVGAVTLLLGQDQGIYWVAAGVLLVFVGSVTTAWVLLVDPALSARSWSARLLANLSLDQLLLEHPVD